MMKNRFRFWTVAIVVLVSLLCIHRADAQSGKLPPFRIMQPNGKVFNARELPVGKPIILIYFSPDCDHCLAMMKDFFKRSADFKNASVVMITFLMGDKLTKFTNDYKVSRYPNITIGTEGTSFFVRNYYKIKQIPFVALHDKNGNRVVTYENKIPLGKLINQLQKLK